MYLKQILKKQHKQGIFEGSYNECSYDTFVSSSFIESAEDFVMMLVYRLYSNNHLEAG